MKKRSRISQILETRRRTRRHERRKNKRLRIHHLRLGQVARSVEQTRRAEGKGWRVLNAPKTIALGRRDSHSKLVSLIQDLKSSVLIDRVKVCVDFRKTERLYADG